MLRNKPFFSFSGYREPTQEEKDFLSFQIYRYYQMNFWIVISLITFILTVTVIYMDIGIIQYYIEEGVFEPEYLMINVILIIPGCLFADLYRSAKSWNDIRKGNFDILEALAYDYIEPCRMTYNPNKYAGQHGSEGERPGIQTYMSSARVKIKTQYGQIWDKFIKMEYEFRPYEKPDKRPFPIYVVKFSDGRGFLITEKSHINAKALAEEEEFYKRKRKRQQGN